VLDSLVDFALASDWVYLLLFGVVALDVLFPVLPSEASVIAAGVLAGTGHLELSVVIAVAAAGAFAGDNATYWLGRTLGERAAARLFRGERARQRIDWAERMLETRGYYLIFIARFIPGGRTAVTFTAGLVRYRWGRFLALTGFAAPAWSAYAALLGYVGGSVFEENPWYGLVIAFAIAGLITVAVEGYRRVRGSES